MLGTVVAGARPAKDEKRVKPSAITEERKLLPEGRKENAR